MSIGIKKHKAGKAEGGHLPSAPCFFKKVIKNKLTELLILGIIITGGAIGSGSKLKEMTSDYYVFNIEFRIPLHSGDKK